MLIYICVTILQEDVRGFVLLSGIFFVYLNYRNETIELLVKTNLIVLLGIWKAVINIDDLFDDSK